MKPGFLHLETNPDYPGRVRVIATETLPDVTEPFDSGKIRLVARFNDVDAAKMHAHEKLKRKIIDIDSGLYRTSLAEAMAAVSTDVLSHKVVWVDPEIEEPIIEEMELLKRKTVARKKWIDLILQIAGRIAILWLLLQLVFSFL